MLNCTNSCIRSLAAGSRFGIRFRGELALRRNLLALSHTSVQQLRNASSIHEQFPLDDKPFDPFDKWPRDRARNNNNDDNDDYGDGEAMPESAGVSNRGLRLSENLDYSRKKLKKARREVSGNREEVDMLMELSKSRSLPESVSSTVVNKELQWLKDPKELALRIARLLAADQVPLAVAMVRKAEAQKMECSAAWNRLLAHCFQRGAPLAAFKFYNDMKKRGRSPTDRTYTIMLKGLSLRSRQIGVKPVETAHKIYKQLLDERSGVKASHFHHHAMLEVCGNYHNMDTLWNVVGDLPEQGPNRPNAQTYTIILLALRNNFDYEVRSLPDSDMKLRQEKRESLILDAKRIWADVKGQWEAGQLEIDNELASTMALILMDPLDEYNTYNVLALFNQTAGIPIFAEKPSSPPMVGSRQGIWEDEVRRSRRQRNNPREQYLSQEQDANLTSKQEFDSSSELELSTDHESPEQALDQAEEKIWVETLEDVFDPVDPKKDGDKVFALLKPDNMILNKILKTCRILTKGTAAGKQYWNLFTQDSDGYKIESDSANYHEYLRLLRVSRSSQGAVNLIRDQMLPAGVVEGKTFHIAMSCCSRDRQNPNVFLNAQEILSIMGRNLPLPDPRPLTSFLDLIVALLSNPQWLLRLRGLEDIDQTATNLTEIGRNMRWSLQKTAISSLEPHVNRLYEAMEHYESLTEAQRLSFLRNRKVTPSSGTVNGFIALNVMVQLRQMLDKLLGPQYQSILTDSDRKWIHPLAIKLRKFSKPQVVKKFEGSTLRPLDSHWDAIRETEGR